MNQIEITIEKIVPEGKGVGIWTNPNGKEFKVYVLGAYPGEKVRVLPYKQKKDFIEAKLVKVIYPNPNRIDAFESHHTSHSPWQTIKYEYQIELKKEILKKCFSGLAGTTIVESLQATRLKLEDTKVSADTRLEHNFVFFESPKKLGYRTKLEFSFDEEPNYLVRRKLEAEGQKIEKTEVFLAFHDRGSHKDMLRLSDGCSLGNKKMNEYANNVLKWINEVGLWEFDLKSLIVRYSKFEDKVVGLLLVKNEGERVQKAIHQFDNSSIQQLSMSNFTIALSDRRSPMAKIDKILFQNGDNFLIEKIGELKFKYYLDSFFQNNIEAFEHSIKLMSSRFGKANTGNSLFNKKILELYSGVGTIGMHFVGGGSEVIGVETIESAVRAAAENSKINKLENYQIKHLEAEKIDSSLLDGIDVLIVDPPRTGLHQKVIKMIQNKLPPQIIYLSCNPITQASDYNLIKDLYDIDYIAGMDYYPNTPHLESLLILNRKS